MTVVIAGRVRLGRNRVEARKPGHRGHAHAAPEPGTLRIATWNPDGEAGSLPPHLEGVDAIVNLAGKASPTGAGANRASARSATAACSRRARSCAPSRRAYAQGPISGQPVTTARTDEAVTGHAARDGFFARLCVEGRQAQAAASAATRVAIIRTGFALDAREGALARCCCRSSWGWARRSVPAPASGVVDSRR